MVERDVWGSPDDDEDAIPVDEQLGEHARVGLEVVEVVLLLQPRVLEELRRADAELRHPLERDRFGDDDLRGRPVAEVVLERRVLVVVGRRARDAEPSGRDRQLVGAVREGEVEAAPLRPALQRPQATGERSGLAEPGAATVAPDHLGVDLVLREELECLGVVARRHLDLVALLPEERDQRAKHQHMGRRRDVDPDLHLAKASSRGSRSAPGVRSTWRSCQSVNASSPQSCRLRSSRPATWSSSRRVTTSGRKNPWRRSVS